MIKSAWNAWDKFWFNSNQPLLLDWFRRAIALVLMSCYLVRTLDLEFFYSNHGILPLANVNESIFMEGRYSVLFWLTSDTALWILHGVFLLALLGMIFKVFPRIATVIAFILHVSFLHRNLLVPYGMDLIAASFLFYLCFADDRGLHMPGATDAPGGAGDVSARESHSWRERFSSIAFRFSQIQLCLIYGYGGLHKLKGMHWWKGEAIWDMVGNVQISRSPMIGNFFAHFPFLMAVLTFLVLAWEVYFPVLIWIKKIRIPMLLIGVAMHITIMLLVDIPYFSLLMICTYVLFLEPEYIKYRLRLYCPRATRLH